MSKYRIVQTTHHGYYNIYQVQVREWFVFPYWRNLRSFNTKQDALDYIKRHRTVPVSKVIHKE